MSVAFRRDGDEEHLEPTFEIPIPPGPNLATAHGLTLIEAQLHALETALKALEDEAEIKAARREHRYWSTRQASARVMPEPDLSCVAFGCRVTFALKGQTRTIAIVGHDEADPASGKLAFSAPLPRAMMDAEIGERVDFGGQVEAIEILEILPLGAVSESSGDST
ncbi:GreA/GreB family elongation factor [Novosphingobium sp. 9]|uniref:GreA/GreB family elongation factor n=1 Tax=Novosphingobium sp. 9 TaxID=2025349 RepID=UPI0021B51CB2|nr:GreA/GreB family elongation factor [Novosphingobium sp. 9]